MHLRLYPPPQQLKYQQSTISFHLNNDIHNHFGYVIQLTTLTGSRASEPFMRRVLACTTVMLTLAHKGSTYKSIVAASTERDTLLFQ